jgi:hypothetical protein
MIPKHFFNHRSTTLWRKSTLALSYKLIHWMIALLRNSESLVHFRFSYSFRLSPSLLWLHSEPALATPERTQLKENPGFAVRLISVRLCLILLQIQAPTFLNCVPSRSYVCLLWVARAIFQLSGDCHHCRRQGHKFRSMLSSYGP